MHPVLCRLHMMTSLRLSNLVGMMCRGEIHSSSMYIKLCPEVLTTHSRTFDMPTREPHTPRSWPAHYMFRLCLYPKSKVQSSTLFVLSAQFPGIIQKIFQFTIR